MSVIARLLLSFLILSAHAETLKADPANDLFTLSQFAYQKALETKNEKRALTEFETAEKWLTKYLKNFPKHEKSAEGYFYIAHCKMKLGKSDQAIKCYVEVLKRTHEGPQAGASALQVGTVQYDLKEYGAAVEYLTLALSQLGSTSSRAKGAFTLALCHQKLEQEKEMEEALDIVLAAKDGKKLHNVCHFMKGDLSLRREDFPTAYKHFKICTNDKNLKIRAQAVHKCALLAQKLGDTRAANGYFSRVLKTPSLVEHHPSTALILMNVAAQSGKKKDITKYESYGAEGLTDEQVSSRLLLLAQGHEAHGDKDKAQSYYTDLARVSAGTATGFEVSYLQLSVKDGDDLTEEEITDFLTLYSANFSTDPRYESVKLLHAEKLFKEDRLEEALAAYRRLNLEYIAEENLPTIAYRICKISIKGENPASALSYIEQFTTEYPDDVRSTYLLYDQAIFLSDLEENEKALQTFLEIIEHKKSPKELLKPSWLYLAQINLKEENYDEAIGAYESLTLKHAKGTDKEELAEWTFWLAYALFKKEETRKAKGNFLRARSHNADFKPMETAQYLALIAYSEKDAKTLKKELARYENLTPTPLPKPIYLFLALEDVQRKDWESAWNYFQYCINSEDLKTDDLISPVILETYAKTALETNHFRETLSTATYLKGTELEPYRKAVNLYRSGLCQYQLYGAKDANQDVEDALNINPQGRLKQELLLLHGKIKMDLGESGDGTRVLTLVYQFAGEENKDLRKEALRYLIKSIEQKTNPDGHNKLKEYQKELELLD